MGLPLNLPCLQEARDRGLIRDERTVQTAALLGIRRDFADEADFQAEVERIAIAGGFECYHTRNSRRSRKGFPDLIAVRNGVQVVAELKMPGNKPTPEQEKWLALFRTVPGCRVFLWYPEHVEQIHEVFR
jgi:hypothetical protein